MVRAGLYRKWWLFSLISWCFIHLPAEPAGIVGTRQEPFASVHMAGAFRQRAQKVFSESLNHYQRRRPKDSTVAAKKSAITDRKYTTSRESSTPRLMES